MNRRLNISLLIFVLTLSARSFNQSGSVTAHHTLNGQIIRSFAVHPENEKLMLVGTKGLAGEGKVYLSEDAGMNWNVLNEGAALCDSCEDIQTVCFVDDQTFLAGTWKNGLYISSNGGKKFSRIKKFPATDVRSVVMASAGVLFAGTTTNGILNSEDGGKTWNSIHDETLNQDLSCWKIAIQPGANRILYALTFKKGVQKSMDGGETWKQTIYEDGLMVWDLGFVNNELYAVAGNEKENFLFHSYLGDKKWKKFKLNMDGNINSLNIARTFLEYQLMLGTWKNGVQTTYAIEYSTSGYRCIEVLKNDTIGVAGIYSNRDYIYNFSWGDGVKMIKRDLECEIIIPSIATNNCKNEPCFEIHSSCPVDYWNFKLYNRWGEFFMKDSTGIASTNQFMNNMQNFKEEGQYIYWLKTSFEDNIDTIQLKGFITVGIN